MMMFVALMFFLCAYTSFHCPNHSQWASLVGDFNNWNPNADVMTRVSYPQLPSLYVVRSLNAIHAFDNFA